MNEIYHYCGHMISSDDVGRFPRSYEAKVYREIKNHFSKVKIESCYGSLASGADILFAEAMLERGSQLHIVLPFDKLEFIKSSVAPSGSLWTQRFESIIQQAKTMTQVFFSKPKNENTSYALCTEIALGLCLLEYKKKEKENLLFPQQITLWDRQKTQSIAGTYPDMLRAQALGIETNYVSSQPPFELAKFQEIADTKIQPLSVCVYDKLTKECIEKMENIDTLINHFNKKEQYMKHSIDLDRDIFGEGDNICEAAISDRAIGHIMFHCIAKQNVSDRDDFINILIKKYGAKILQGSYP